VNGGCVNRISEGFVGDILVVSAGNKHHGAVGNGRKSRGCSGRRRIYGSVDIGHAVFFTDKLEPVFHAADSAPLQLEPVARPVFTPASDEPLKLG
jgi:hypothetical protein